MKIFTTSYSMHVISTAFVTAAVLFLVVVTLANASKVSETVNYPHEFYPFLFDR